MDADLRAGVRRAGGEYFVFRAARGRFFRHAEFYAHFGEYFESRAVSGAAGGADDGHAQFYRRQRRNGTALFAAGVAQRGAARQTARRVWIDGAFDADRLHVGRRHDRCGQRPRRAGALCFVCFARACSIICVFMFSGSGVNRKSTQGQSFWRVAFSVVFFRALL